jgi:membrane-bound lytic murein transglycosylase F
MSIYCKHPVLHGLSSWLLIVALCGLTACENNSNDSASHQAEHSSAGTSLLERIRQRGKLVVLTTNQPTTYYIDRDNQPAGPEYDMSQSFASSLGVDVEYRQYDSIKEVIEALRDDEGDIAASALTINDRRTGEFDFGPVYQTTNEYLVCHRDSKRISNKAQLRDLDIVIAADTSYTETMKAYPEVKWQTDKQHSTVELMRQVADHKIGCTVSDSTLYNIERRYHIEIQNKYTLSKASQLAWMLNKHHDALKQAIANWFEHYKETGELAKTLEKYYGFVEIFDYVDTHKFLKRSKTRLPKYQQLFIDAAEQNKIEASLLAAQSYQESHWDRKAKSPTGVRGIMMLTQPVAKSLGVTSRLDAKQNIYAGAKFLAKMKKMVTDVSEPDRSWLALAAYNIGRGHFRDAQALAEKLNRNPDSWHDMKTVLPLLSKKQYYKDLNHGYARGSEPVRYVNRIRNYQALLERHFDGISLMD